MTSTSSASFQRLQQFVRSHLVETITVTITSSFLLTGVSTWNIWKVYQGFQGAISKQFTLQERSADVRYYDEVLTMSARMAAQTGSAQWEQRYNAAVPKLEAAIKESLAGATEAIRQQAAATDTANQALIQLETEAFDRVKKGNLVGAQGILLSDEYSTQKAKYSQGNDLVLQSIAKLINDQLNSYRQELLVSIGFALVIFPILLASWILVLAAVRSYIAERQATQTAIQASEQELRQTNAELQQTAAQRQQEQQAVERDSLLLQQDIAELLDAVADLEAGDLTTIVPVSDRVTGLVGDTLNRLTEQWGRVMVEFDLAAQQVAGNSSQQKSLATQVVQSTTEQSKSIRSVLYLTNSVRDSAKIAVQQLLENNKSLGTLQSNVSQSQSSMESLDQEAAVLQSGSDRIVQQIKTLGEFVGLADRFVQDQNEISIQTQILALNAALVASRAAEQRDPQKFAAVAREFESIANQVSQLAQQTSEGLTELEQRSSQINQVVTAVDGEVQQLGSFVHSFLQEVKAASQTFALVQAVTEQVVTSGDTVAQTSQQILKSTGLTVSTMNSISELAQQIATEAQTTATMGDQMESLSQNLLESVQLFTLPTTESSPAEIPRAEIPEPSFASVVPQLSIAPVA